MFLKKLSTYYINLSTILFIKNSIKKQIDSAFIKDIHL